PHTTPYPLSLHDALPISERQHDIAAVDVSRLPLIHEKQVITALATTNVYVFAYFDVAVSSKYEESPIAPRSEPIRSEPIHADIRSEEHTSELQSPYDLVC